MIPQAYITEWRTHAPWLEFHQVEQDLVLSKALVQIYSDINLKDAFAFRGGTALQKIVFPSPARYSEDIDLVQIRKEPIGDSISAIRALLDPWLGKPNVDRKDARVTVIYKFKSEVEPVVPMRVKVEINTGEHFTVLKHKRTDFEVKSSWFNGKAKILTFEIEELLGTKLRALYQRKKGRDLYDMLVAIQHFKSLDCYKVVECFKKYITHQKLAVSRAQFELNLLEKIEDNAFKEDIVPLLKPGAPKFNARTAAEILNEKIISLLPGAPWKGRGSK